MRRLASLCGVISIVLLTVSPALAQTARPGKRALPSTIIANLDRRFPGWKFALPNDATYEAFGKNRGRSRDGLCVATADFDGNGARDFVVWVQTGTADNDTRLIVYLRRGTGYRHRTLHRGSPVGELYVTVARKGTKDHSYTDDRDFVYRLDTIEFGGEKGGSSYLYEHGRFREIISSD